MAHNTVDPESLRSNAAHIKIFTHPPMGGCNRKKKEGKEEVVKKNTTKLLLVFHVWLSKNTMMQKTSCEM